MAISTLHTNDAPSAITRLLELGVAPYLIKAALLGVMAQRLVRTLWPHCASKRPSDKDGWKMLTTRWKRCMAQPPAEMSFPAVCLECRETGYMGREEIYEVLPVTDAIKNWITPNAEIGKLRLAAMKEGMKTQRFWGALKVAEGRTTIEEVVRVAPITNHE